jgi:hypothetical protein
MGYTSEESRIIFGGYDLKKYAKKGSVITWNELTGDRYWTLKLHGVSMEKHLGYINKTKVETI